MPEQEFVRVRASSLPEFLDCGYRWRAKNMLGMRMPGSAATQLGTAVHAGTAAFDQAILDGNPITIDDASEVVVETINKPNEDIDWGDDSVNDAEKIGISLVGLYCKEIAPKQKYGAVEALCENLEIIDLGLKLTGTTDRVTVAPDGSLGIADLKTGKSAVDPQGVVKTSGHAAQMAVYEILAEAAIGRRMTAPAQIIGLQVAKTAKGQRVGIGEISGARELLVGDDEHKGILQLISTAIKEDAFAGNPRSRLCDPKFCPVYHQCWWRK